MSNKFIKNWAVPIGIILILVAIVLITIFLLRGETTVINNETETERRITVSCEIAGLEYPFFRYDNSIKKTTKVAFLFSNEKFKTISLSQAMYYDDGDLVKNSEAQNHAAMGISFGENGLDANALSSAYSMQADKMVMTLYATENDFNINTSKYFLAQGYSSKSTVDGLKKNYAAQGFTCIEEGNN